MFQIRLALMLMASSQGEDVSAHILPLTEDAEAWSNPPLGWSPQRIHAFHQVLKHDPDRAAQAIRKCFSAHRRRAHPLTPQTFCKAIEAHLRVRKVAFNKYNAPEVMGQLIGLLKQHNLEEPLELIQQHRIPQAINEAWRMRER